MGKNEDIFGAFFSYGETAGEAVIVGRLVEHRACKLAIKITMARPAEGNLEIEAIDRCRYDRILDDLDWTGDE